MNERLAPRRRRLHLAGRPVSRAHHLGQPADPRRNFVTGVTTNPTIFAAALAQGHMYDDQIKEPAARDAELHDAIKALTTDDVRNACDIMVATFAATNGVDGRVSIEVDPDLADETDATTARPPTCGRSSIAWSR